MKQNHRGSPMDPYGLLTVREEAATLLSSRLARSTLSVSCPMFTLDGRPLPCTSAAEERLVRAASKEATTKRAKRRPSRLLKTSDFAHWGATNESAERQS
jgi:hypothetical protein